MFKHAMSYNRHFKFLKSVCFELRLCCSFEVVHTAIFPHNFFSEPTLCLVFSSLRCTATVFTMSSFHFSETGYIHSILLFIGDI